MADIDSLSIQISSDASSAVNGLETLSDTLGRLKDATKGGLGLSSIANQVGKLAEYSNNINGTTTVSNLKGLADGMKRLSEIGNLKISSSIANQITKINTALSGLNIGDGANKISELVSALKPLETLGKSSLNTTVNALNKLPEALKKLDTRQLYTQIQSLTRIFKPLADEMQKVANGFNAFPSRIQKLITENGKLNASNNKVSTSYINLWAKLRMAYNAIKTVAKTIAGFIKLSNDYVENMNLFNASMGKYAEEARNYAEQVGEVMGIDPGEWMRNQGMFMTLATGFGVVSDRAYTMSKNLTQLGYDISSFFNIPYEDAMAKLQSGLAGELEPLRRIGYDLSQARLQQEAYTLGITKKVSAMTQAEKAELRYYAIMTQVTTAQGDMARTLNAPANQLRVLSAQVSMAGRALGNIFIPALNAILPIAIAVVKVIRLLAESIASLFGYELPTVDYSGIEGMASGADDVATALDGAGKSAKELQKYTMGFDELNVIDPNQGSSSNSGNDGASSGTGFDFELPEYDFLDGVISTKVDEIVGKLMENLGTILGLVTGIGIGLLAWKLSESFLTGLAAFSTALGLGILIDSIRLTLKEGLSWKSAIEGAIGGALMGAGIGFMFGGWSGALGGVVIGIGVSLVINGITGIIADGVQVEDVVAIITGILTTVGGILTAIKLFNSKNKSPVPDIDTAGKTIGDTSTGMSTLTGKLKILATNLAWGTLIIAEVAIAAGIIVGSIWGIGVLLDQVGQAWQPVIDNGGTVAIAIGIGTGLLVGIGVATALLGTAGGAMAAQIGIGIAILAELGVATGLFLVEIWGIGVLLDQIGQAWQPVIDNGETIATGIGIGTGLLVGIGVVTAALGAATVATAGALPLAIGIGTALLVELAVAFVLFCDSLKTVANKLKNDLHPALKKLNKILPELNENLDEFIEFMKEFAELTVTFTTISAISGFSATVGKIIGFFTVDPIKSLAKDVYKQYEQAVPLNDNLELANPELKEVTPSLDTYKQYMKDIADVVIECSNTDAISGFSATVSNVLDFFTADPLKSLAKDVYKQYEQAVPLNENLALANPQLEDAITGLKDYKSHLESIKEVTDSIDTTEMATSVFTDMVEISKKLASFGGEMKKYYEKIQNINFTTMNEMANCMNAVIDFAVRIKNGVDTTKINNFTKSINNLATAVKNLPTQKTLKITAIYETSGYAPRLFASGGYPDTGEMFIAREAGPELVGNIGRKTAVVNNEQIVASVARGVADANSEQNSLLKEQNSLLRALLEKESGVYLDGKRLTNSVEKYQSQRGRRIVVGGAL